MSGGAVVLTSELSKEVSARARVQKAAELRGLENQITRESKLNDMVAGIKTQQQLATVVDVTVPDYQKKRIVTQYNLQGLISPSDYFEEVKGEVKPTTELSQGFQISQQKSQELVDKKAQNLIDISWMNEDVFFGSGVIVGAKGSGKTELLKFIILNILRLCPEANVKFYNMHYLPGKTKYFEGMEDDFEQSLFIKDPRDILRDAEKCYAELQRREKVGDFTSPPIIRILDEQKAVLAELGTDFDRLIFLLKELVDRGRKYGKQVNGFDTGFVVWLALHNPKKGSSKIDSSWFNVGHTFLLGKTISDSTNPLPVDFDRKELTTQLAATNRLLESNGLKSPENKRLDLARAFVYRSSEDDPCIKILPKFDLEKVQYTPQNNSEGSIEYTVLDCAGETWIEKILNWFRTNSTVDNEILREQVDLVRKTLLPPENYSPISNEHLIQLRDLLEKDVNGGQDEEEV